MYALSDMIEGLKRFPRILLEFATSIPEEKRHRRRGKDFWTVAEHVSHLAQVQPMLLERLQRFMNEDQPTFIPYMPDEGEEDPPQVMEPLEALDAFSRSRREQLAVLNQVDDEKVWLKSGRHPEYDRYSLLILVRHILMHDYWHMYRMEELWLTKDSYLTVLS